MTIEEDVLRGIIGAAIQAVGAQYPIKAPGRVFKKPDNGKFVELVVIQDNNTDRTWGNEQRFSGDIRVILHWPNDDAGIYDPVREISLIKAAFFKGRQIWQGNAKLLINSNPVVTDGIEGVNDILYPLIVTYEYFHVPA